MRPINSVVSGLVAVAALAGSAAGQDPSPRREQQVDSLFSEYTKDLSPGATVAVVRDGKVLLTKGYGYASLEHRTPISPTTVFDVASVSKQFTGLAVAMLIDQGRVKPPGPRAGRCPIRPISHRRHPEIHPRTPRRRPDHHGQPPAPSHQRAP